MLKCILTIGAPASGKSFWAKQEVAKDPSNWVRINNDDLRAMTNGSIYSADYEKFITETRNFLIKEAVKRKKNIIIDNVNANRRHFETVCKIVKESNQDAQVFEKPFYEELATLLERNSKREGLARVPEDVVKKWYKELGGNAFKFYHPRVEVFNKRTFAAERFAEPMNQNDNLHKCVIFDLDGTMCNISHRNPYDASNCDKDKPNKHVVELCKLFFKNDHKIFFFSGREDQHKEITMAWLDSHFGHPYELYMRETGNKEDDRLLKERLFNTHVKEKFNCNAWVDDRLRVCKFVHEAGLPLFRVGDPEANF